MNPHSCINSSSGTNDDPHPERELTAIKINATNRSDHFYMLLVPEVKDYKIRSAFEALLIKNFEKFYSQPGVWVRV